MDDLKWIADSGHGWLRVPLATMRNVSVSQYSYADLKYAYLEEDCDAGVWAKIHEIDLNTIPTEYIDGSCFVRNLPRIGVYSGR